LIDEINLKGVPARQAGGKTPKRWFCHFDPALKDGASEYSLLLITPTFMSGYKRKKYMGFIPTIKINNINCTP